LRPGLDFAGAGSSVKIKAGDKSGSKQRVQFAALPWRRRGDGSIEVLLITSRETKRWVVPKGWPMVGLGAKQVARREAFEEAGVKTNSAMVPLGAYRYRKMYPDGKAKQVRVRLFGLLVSSEHDVWPEVGQREKLWTTRRDAAERVHEPDLKVLIRTFKPT